jgi:hypothetical protein
MCEYLLPLSYLHPPISNRYLTPDLSVRLCGISPALEYKIISPCSGAFQLSVLVASFRWYFFQNPHFLINSFTEVVRSHSVTRADTRLIKPSIKPNLFAQIDLLKSRFFSYAIHRCIYLLKNYLTVQTIFEKMPRACIFSDLHGIFAENCNAYTVHVTKKIGIFSRNFFL